MLRIRPDVVEPMYAISTAEKIQLIAPGDHGVVCSRWWDLAVRRSAIDGVLDQDFPPVRRLLKRVEVESYQIVEKVALDLSTKDVDLAAEDVECMAVSPWRPRTSWQCS